MSKTLQQIALQLKDTPKKVQLIYAFNGTGKTRLSLEFKKLIVPKLQDVEDLFEAEDIFEIGNTRSKFLYYNAHTEDLFYWDNDLEGDAEPKLIIQPNSFTDWILNEQGDVNIIKNFQLYTDEKLTPQFSEIDVIKESKKTGKKTYPEVSFSYTRGDDTNSGNIKISKGEERNFVWSVFYTLLQEVVSILAESDPTKRADNQFDKLEYVFIDDPVSSLDENHLIELAVSLATLIKSSAYEDGKGLKFIITTHNPLFYNVLWNEFNNDFYKNKRTGRYRSNKVDNNEEYKHIYKRGQCDKFRLVKNVDGTFELKNTNDHPFSYHLFLLSELRNAISRENIEKYHFSFVRNLLEKTATFLGYKKWENLLDGLSDDLQNFVQNRILNLYSHSAHGGEEGADVKPEDLEKLQKLVEFLTETYGFCKAEENI